MNNARSNTLNEILESLGCFKTSLMEQYKVLRDTYGLTPPMVKILLDVRKQPVSLRDLADKYHITPGAITQFVDTLVAKSLVVRNEDPQDRRITRISIADGAQDQVEAIAKMHRAAVEKIFDTLSDEELGQLRDLLQICAINKEKES